MLSEHTLITQKKNYHIHNVQSISHLRHINYLRMRYTSENSEKLHSFFAFNSHTVGKRNESFLSNKMKELFNFYKSLLFRCIHFISLSKCQEHKH